MGTFTKIEVHTLKYGYIHLNMGTCTKIMQSTECGGVFLQIMTSRLSYAAVRFRPETGTWHKPCVCALWQGLQYDTVLTGTYWQCVISVENWRGKKYAEPFIIHQLLKQLILLTFLHRFVAFFNLLQITCFLGKKCVSKFWSFSVCCSPGLWRSVT